MWRQKSHIHTVTSATVTTLTLTSTLTSTLYTNRHTQAAAIIRGVHGPKFYGPAWTVCWIFSPVHLSAVLLGPAQQGLLAFGPGKFTSSKWVYNFKTYPILLLMTTSLAQLCEFAQFKLITGMALWLLVRAGATGWLTFSTLLVLLPLFSMWICRDRIDKAISQYGL